MTGTGTATARRRGQQGLRAAEQKGCKKNGEKSGEICRTIIRRWRQRHRPQRRQIKLQLPGADRNAVGEPEALQQHVPPNRVRQ